MPAKLRHFMQVQKPDIKITLNSKKRTYTTLDQIDGKVSITAPVDTPFDGIEIEFVGTSRTFVERLTTAAAVSGRSEAFHQFLKLTQPRLQDQYPEDQILKAGQRYDFPFVFVVPQQLLPRICQHKIHNPLVRDAHLTLPPTFGDKALASQSETVDDMAPEMASVRYGVFARVSRIRQQGEELHKLSVASKARRLRVIPATDEMPPLDVRSEETEYIMRKERSIRKGMLKGKAGTLVMEAAQPQSLRLRHSNNTEARTTTMATVMLRFDPAEDNLLPPKLGSLASKLKVSTFFASTARFNIPTKDRSPLDLSQGMHTEQINLSARCMANVEWAKIDPSKPEGLTRRDSACSTASVTMGDVPLPSEQYKDKMYYTARLLVPITLPINKSFVPTFHSCLISRSYTLKLDLGISTGGIGPSVELKVPIQISSEASSGDASPQRDSFEESADVDAEDAADFFEPRHIRIPSEAFVGRSRIGSQAPVGDAPPGYSPFAEGRSNRSASVPVY